MAALCAVTVATQTYADVKVGEDGNGWSVCEERYLTSYVEAHEAGIDVGRNLADDGALREDGSATPISDDRACSEAEQFDLALNPPAPEPVAAPTTTTAITPTSTATYSGALPDCTWVGESGGSYTALNPSSGAGGKYQFLPSTWSGLGYSGLPHQASPAMQEQAAAELYAQSGTEPWVNC